MNDTLNHWFVMEDILWNLSREIPATKEKIAQAKWDIRQKNAALVKYESGLRGILDKFTGKQEEKLESLNREIRHGEETSKTLARELEQLTEKQCRLQEAAASLPELDAFRTQALSDPETRRPWAELEAAFCAKKLKLLLAQTDGALEEYRSQLRGERMGEIVSHERLHEIGTDHIAPARQCAELMERMRPAMEILEEEWEIPGYFRNPEGFIVSAAARHNRIDRVSQALSHVAAVKKQIAKL